MRRIDFSIDVRQFAIVSFFLFFLSVSPFSPAMGQEMGTTFSIWLLSNESRVMNILATDREVMEKMEMPFGVFFRQSHPFLGPETALWKVHQRFFIEIRDLAEIFELSRKFGSRDFAKVFASVHPGIWATLPFLGGPAFAGRKLSPTLDKVFKMNTIKAMGIESSSDADLHGRLEKAIKGISDTERRLLLGYLDNFIALYPKDKYGKVLETMLKSGMKKDFSQKIAATVGEFLDQPASIGTSTMAYEPETTFDGSTQTVRISSSTASASASAKPGPDSDAELNALLDSFTGETPAGGSGTTGISSSTPQTPKSDGGDVFNILN